MEGEANPPLLELPPELRNRIYEYALHETAGIQLVSSLKLLLLLETCRRVRNEARSLWFHTNIFHLNVVDCDATLADTFNAINRNGTQLCVNMHFSFHRHQPNWHNLIAWCHRSYKSRLAFGLRNEDASPPMTVVQSAHEIVAAAIDEGASWAMCERQLEASRKVAWKLDARWLD
jgi:hypothetical protein